MVDAVVVSDPDESREAEAIDAQPVAVVDTTAELLGRAKPRRPRARAAGMTHGLEVDGNRRAARGARARRPARKSPGGRRTPGSWPQAHLGGRRDMTL